MKINDTERLEFLIRTGLPISWTCKGDKCFIFPHTNYHRNPREAIDEVMSKGDNWKTDPCGTDGIQRYPTHK